MKRYFVSLLCWIFLCPVVALAGGETDSLGLFQQTYGNYTGVKPGLISQSNQSSEAKKKKWFRAMRYSGWARFYPFYRNMKEHYGIATPDDGLSFPINLSADDGYQQPLMLIKLEANPSAKTSFESELQFNNYLLTNTFRTDGDGRYVNQYVLFNFKGTTETQYGKYTMIAGGGVNWYRLSPFTLWGYQYRDDMFERYPWDPEGHDFGRYNSFYSTGDIPRDQRFGMQATQGFILEGKNLPGNFEAAVLYGKTNTSGGFQSYLKKTPLNMFASRVANNLGDHKIGFNYFNQFGFTSGKIDYKEIVQGTDTFYVQDNYESQIITSIDGRFDLKKLKLFAEVGAGSYLTNQYNDGLRSNIKTGPENISRYKRLWDETMFLEVTTQKSLTYIPIKLEMYRIGALIINNTSTVSNTSVEMAKPSPDTPDEYFINYYDGMVTDIGQLANNRQGVNLYLNKDLFYNKVKTKLSIAASQEVENLAGELRNGGRATAVAGGTPDSLTQVPFTNSITFQHRLNSLTRSRFGFYRRFLGPYNRLHSIFRRTYENVAITDTDIDYKKSFNEIDFDIKYKFKLLGKEIIMSSFTSFNSIQDKFSPIPVFTDKAFLRIFYTELMAFYAVHQKITLVGFVGTERVTGNNRTELADANGDLIQDANGRPIADPNGKPIDQTGYGYGLGLDYNFHSRASLHLRHRWFTHEDKNFIRDRFKGNEMTMEFKVFF